MPPTKERIPAVALTPSNIALLVGAIIGLLSISMFVKTLDSKLDRALDALRDIRAQQEWILRNFHGPVAPTP